MLPLLGGVLADRVNKRNIMVFLDLDTALIFIPVVLILAAFNFALSPAMIVGIPVMIINIFQLNDAALGLGGYVLTADRPSALWRPAGPTIPSARHSPKLSTSKAPFRRIQRQEGAFINLQSAAS